MGWAIARGQKIGIFSYIAGPAGHVPQQADLALGIGQATGIHTGTGKQCADAIQAGIGAGGPACIHTGTGSGALGGQKPM